MKKFRNSLAPFVFVALFALSGCAGEMSNEESSPPTDDSESQETEDIQEPQEEESGGEDTNAEDSAEPEGDSFVDGTLTTDELTISITDTTVISPGEEGNLYGDVPVLAVYYDITNLGTSESSVSPLTSFILYFEAFQDNDPNRTNKLDQGGVPGDEFRDQQLEDIKPGGTLSHAVAYELDDLQTPVDLVAGFISEIGRMTIELE
jgi:hypothetical protein